MKSRQLKKPKKTRMTQLLSSDNPRYGIHFILENNPLTTTIYSGFLNYMLIAEKKQENKTQRVNIRDFRRTLRYNFERHGLS